MSSNRAPLVIPVLIIVLGVGWLLTVQGFAPGVNWIWILALGVVGVLTFVLSKGLDKVSVVLGPFFLVASLLSILRQTGNVSLDIEVPVLVISVGILLLAAQLPAIPKPDWYLDLPAPAEGPGAAKRLRVEDAGALPDRTAERGGSQDGV